MNLPVRIFDLASDTDSKPVTPPPGGKDAPSPTTPAPPQTANRGCPPLQTITPANPISANLSSCAANYAVNGSEFWSTVWYFNSRPIKFTLTLPGSCDVTLSLVMRTCLPFPSAIAVIVNGQTLHTYNPSHDAWFTQHISIPASFLAQGTNHIVLETPAAAHTRLGIPLGIWVQSASIGWNPGLVREAAPDEVCPPLAITAGPTNETQRSSIRGAWAVRVEIDYPTLPFCSPGGSVSDLATELTRCT